VDPLGRLVRQQDGMITRWQALRHMSEKALDHKLASGRWRRVYRGLFLAHRGSLTTTQQWWAAILLAGGDRDHSVCLAGLNALCAWGLRGVQPDGIHVLVPPGNRRRMPLGIHPHRTKVPPALDGARHLRPVATPPGRSLVDAVAWARTDQEARLAIAASFQQGLVELADVERAAAEQVNVARRALLLATARDCSGGSHSVAELSFLSLCRQYGLPVPSRQALRRDRYGRARYVDLLFEEWKVAVEIDGAHHLDVQQMWDDAIKSNALQLDGYVVLRYPAFALRDRPAQIAAEIREALQNAGWK
jgi:hypothetical protein